MLDPSLALGLKTSDRGLPRVRIVRFHKAERGRRDTLALFLGTTRLGECLENPARFCGCLYRRIKRRVYQTAVDAPTMNLGAFYIHHTVMHIVASLFACVT